MVTAIPLNKQLYSLSYVCVTSGAAALVFSAFYILVQILDYAGLVTKTQKGPQSSAFVVTGLEILHFRSICGILGTRYCHWSGLA